MLFIVQIRMIWTSLIQVSDDGGALLRLRFLCPIEILLVSFYVYQLLKSSLFLLPSDEEDVTAETRTHKEFYFKKAAHRTRPGPSYRNGESKSDDRKANVSSLIVQSKNYLFTDENMDYSEGSDEE